jgi:hypothetical protein
MAATTAESVRSLGTDINKDQIRKHNEVVMALQGLCGFDARMSSLKRNVECESEVEHYSKNFVNNLELAMPPFPNVSTYFR